MKDFVINLQEEVKRLASITNDLKKQLVQCGGTPEIPDHLKPGRLYLGPDGKTYLPAFKNCCPTCKTFKQTTRPTSAGRIRQQGDFRIRKGNGAARRLTKEPIPTLSNQDEEQQQQIQLSRVSSRGGVTSLGQQHTQALSTVSRRKQLLGLWSELFLLLKKKKTRINNFNLNFTIINKLKNLNMVEADAAQDLSQVALEVDGSMMEGGG